MFAHQVIDYFNQDKQFLQNYGADDFAKITNLIKCSQKFHLGNGLDFYAPFINRLKNDPVLFCGNLGKEIKLPYEQCWFDGTIKTKDVNCKFGILVLELFPDVLLLRYFHHEFGVWKTTTRRTYYLVGKTFRECPDVIEYLKIAVPGLKEQTVLNGNCFSTVNKYRDTLIGSFDNLGHGMDVFINLAMLWLSCKNIETVKNKPPEALNKKRIKCGKQPLFTYHTLVLKPVGKKQESIPKDLWNNRIHLQRGHFKTYTPEKPLFGHITGRFWWQAHVRGQNRNGIVVKDYTVKN